MDAKHFVGAGIAGVLLAGGLARADVVVDTFDAGGGFSGVNNDTAASYFRDTFTHTYLTTRFAAKFTVGPCSYTLDSLSVPLARSGTDFFAGTRVRIVQDNGNVPGATVEVLAASFGPPLDDYPFTIVSTFASATHPLLEAGQSYWIVTELNNTASQNYDILWYWSNTGPTSTVRNQTAVNALVGDPWTGGNLFDDPVAFRVEGTPVSAGPMITTQPRDGSECRGGSAVFSVVASGAQTYQWQLETAPGVWTTLGNDPLPLACGGFAHATPPNADTVSIGVSPCPGQNRYRVRCVAGSPCGSSVSDAVTLAVNSADFNGDGDLGTDADIAAFFACLSGTCCATCGSADFNGDGNLGTDADIESFFRVLGGGGC